MKPSTFIQVKVWAVPLALCTALGGCAVLTVDVDVYKGALVNEEDVQLHQLVALTTAARPLLVQLRDNLEWPDSDGLPPKGFTGKGSSEASGWLAESISPSACPSADSWYEPKYVKPPYGFVPEYKSGARTMWEALPFVKPTCHTFFTHSHARRVNDLLQLYEDLDANGEVISLRDSCIEKIETQDRNRSVSKVAIKGLTSRLKKPFSAPKAREDCSTNTSMEGTAANQLMLNHEDLATLVEFAQKVLFVANHDGLLNPPSASGLIVGGIADLNRALFGDALTDYKFSPHRIFQLDALDAKRTQYVRVLQAVGNSILFSANELRERERYRDVSKEKGRAEVVAANSIYSPTPKDLLEDLMRELLRDRTQAEKRLVDAIARRDSLNTQVGQDNPATGLHASLKDDSAEVIKAQNSLEEYRTQTRPIESLQRVLSKEVRGEIRAQFEKADKEDASPPDDFLHELKTILETRKTARDGTPTREETEQFVEAISSVGNSKTKDAFKAERQQKEYTSKKLTVLFNEFVEYLGQLERERDEGLKLYEKAREVRKQRHQEVMSTIAQLMAEIKKLESLIVQLPRDIDRFETARSVLLEVKADVVDDAEKTKQFVSPDTVYTLVVLNVDKKIKSANSEGQKRYQDAQDDLSSRTPPFGMSPLNPNDYESPLAVMDRVIALLRHQQMKAIDHYGKDSDEDKQAKVALENAYQHRAGMIYIRPSSAYLRTSFPSTSLQDDPNLAWDNMLLKQGIRNMPFSSQLRDILDPSVARDRLLTAELDKQYWQNINRVRVSGAGFTNQALVKDDVGNWYVKHYFGDTEKIFKSAKHLALYSLGTKLPIDLSHELRKGSGTKDDSKKSAAEKEAELPPLQQVFGKHRNAYHAHTADTATKLTERHGQEGTKTVYAQIVAAWKRDAELAKDADLVKALTAVLAEEVVQWDKTLEPLNKASDQERGLAITKDLYALAKFDKLLSARIRQSQKEGPLKSQAAKAADEAHRVVGPVLFDLLKDYKQGLDRYEQAVLFIGDAANPKDSKQEQRK